MGIDLNFQSCEFAGFQLVFKKISISISIPINLCVCVCESACCEP